MDLELRHLRALVAVAEAGTFTAAAERLHVSQAAVSRTVAALERALGARLLDRNPRAVALTPVGREVLEQAHRVLDEVVVLHRLAAAEPAELRVGYAWAALGRRTPQVQRGWARDHPGTVLQLVLHNTPSAGLLEGVVDVAVLRLPPDDPRLADGRLCAAPLGSERRYAALSTDDPLARRRTLLLADLRERVIAVDPASGTTTLDLWPSGGGPSRSVSVSGVEQWLTVIAAGQAVGLSTEATVAQHARAGVAYRRVRDAPEVPVQLAWWADRPPPHLADLLRLLRG